MQRYALLRNVLGSNREVSISQEQFRLAQHSFRRMELTVAAEEKFDAVARNYLDFEADMMASVLETSLAGFGNGMGPMAIRRLLNRRLSNLLSATRAYVDYMRHSAKLVLDQEIHSKAIVDRFSHHYDSSLAFRVFEALRNFTQHSGFPVHTVRYSTKVLHEKLGAPLKKTIAPLLEIEALKSDGQFKAPVLRELETRGSTANLKVLAREYVACLAEVHDIFREHSARTMAVDTQVLDQLANTYIDKNEDQGLRIGLYAAALNGQTWTGKVPLYAGLNEYGGFLANSNSLFIHAGICFVSSEPEEDA
jgi:hypothetical protein